MNRRKFLSSLAELWKKDGTTKFELCLEDLLDDAATLGLEGAARLYVQMITPPIDRQKN